jgi:hypothetical protein
MSLSTHDRFLLKKFGINPHPCQIAKRGPLANLSKSWNFAFVPSRTKTTEMDSQYVSSETNAPPEISVTFVKILMYRSAVYAQVVRDSAPGSSSLLTSIIC